MRNFGVALLACLALVSMTAPGAAATDYWAFGDSITRGGTPPSPAFPFGFFLDWPAGLDCTIAATSYPTKCGYHWRLENALALAGIPNDVFNRGVAGEGTPAAVSRIELAGEPLETSRCTDSNAGDVLLLMEGTNNVSAILAGFPGISTTTTKNDLGAMIQKATDKCVHSVVASTIRRLLAGTPLGTWTGDPLEPVTLELKNKIVALAGEKNRAYVDVWTALCPNQACYNVRFHARLVPGDPGHVNQNGYTTMAPIFQVPITLTPLPGAATLTGPSGDVTDSTPLFSWNEHAHSDWYFLEVDGGTGYERWHPEEDICAGGVCSFDPMSALADGDHTWRVRTRNLRGVGSWSASGAFSVWTAPPAASSPGYPNTDVFDTTPIYEWSEVANATEYDLEVDTNLIQQTYLASNVCSGGLCSATPATALAVGPHSWRVRTRNPFSNGPWSGTSAFEVLACSPLINDLPGATVSGTLLESACTELIVGNLGAYTVAAPGGDVTFHAGETVTIHNGFTVEESARFTAIVDK
ncbi:MAG: hypothetical protein GY769_12015 [bacterium]|nr:hypothetical protein [bacterium]